MSRRFTAATPSVMRYTLPTTPAAGPVNYAYGTWLAIVRFVTSPSWASLIEFDNSSGTFYTGLGRDSGGNLVFSDGVSAKRSSDAGTGTTFTIGTGDGWCLYYVTKATGSVGVTLGKIPLATGTHTSRSLTATSANASLASAGRINIGGDEDAADVEYVLAAVFPGVVLNSTQLAGIVSTLTTANVISLAPSDGWVVDDSDAFNLNLVANNTNRTTDSGTTDDADDPAGWVYGAGGGSSDATVTSPVMDATGDLVAPTVTTPDATVIAPVMDALGDFPDTGMIVSVDVTTPVAAATGDMLAPTVSGSSAGTVISPVMAATGDMVAPTVAGGSGVTAPVADATGDLTAPGVTATATVTSPVADAAGDLLAPVQVGEPQDRVRLGNVQTGGALVNPRGLTGGNGPAHQTGGSVLLSRTGGSIVELIPA